MVGEWTGGADLECDNDRYWDDAVVPKRCDAEKRDDLGVDAEVRAELLAEDPTPRTARQGKMFQAASENCENCRRVMLRLVTQLGSANFSFRRLMLTSFKRRLSSVACYSFRPSPLRDAASNMSWPGPSLLRFS